MKKSLLLLPILAATLTTDASAVAVPVNNFSFEVDAQVDGTSGSSTPPSNWTLSPVDDPLHSIHQAGSQNPHDALFDGTTGSPGLIPGGEGTQFLYVNSYVTDATTYVHQNVGLLQPDTLYTLTVAIGNRKDRVNEAGFFSLVNGSDYLGTTLAISSGFPSIAGIFQDYSLQFTTGSSVSGDLTIVLSNPNSTASPGDIQTAFDNIRLDATMVPEPSSAIALLAGISTLCGVRRFRRSRATAINYFRIM